MRNFMFAAAFASLASLTAHAVEVALPNSAGTVDITNGVVTIAENAKVADGEYKVTVDGQDVTVVVANGKGSIKQ